jgi:Fe-S-cluster containining protein
MKDQKTNLHEFLEDIEAGIIKKLNNEDKFKFTCTVCGECCRNRDNEITVFPYEMFNLCKALNMKSQEVVEKHCKFYVGDNSGIPYFTIRFKEVGTGDNSYTVCSLLRKQDGVFKCMVHEYKPLVCALYPLGRLYNKNTKEVNYFLQPIVCNAKLEDEHTLSSWLEQSRINDTEQLFSDFNIFISRVTHIFKFREYFDNDKISDKSKNMFCNLYVSILYGDLQDSKDIRADLNKRYDKVIELCNDLKKNDYDMSRLI